MCEKHSPAWLHTSFVTFNSLCLNLQLTPIGYSYLGGGDNGQGRNAVVKGVAQDPCPPGTTKQLLNADGTPSPGEDPGKLLDNYCVPCPVGTYCDTTTESKFMTAAGHFISSLLGSSVHRLRLQPSRAEHVSQSR
jgi:hypothetical protein